MDIYTAILAVLVVILILLNIYQYLVQRAALRIAEILFVMSRNVREKANEVRLDGKDVEIIEAHRPRSHVIDLLNQWTPHRLGKSDPVGR